jgi:hypothetical protein
MSHTSSPAPSTPASAPTSRCLIGGRGYDSDGLDDLLMTQYGIEMIAANRRGRAKTQDGRPLRRAKRRWKIERLLPGSTTAAASSRAGGATSVTAWRWCSAHAPGSCSGQL